MDQNPLVEISNGIVRGQRLEGDGAPVHFFGNVPYAQPPFGRNRFKAPQPIASWSGVRDASTFGVAAPQAPRVLDDAPTVVGGEDCLTLNVWTTGTSTRKPVLIYLPGGGFMRGQSGDPIYDGASFARNGIVFVSFNYRIGMDGFMLFDETDDGIAPQNRGLLDQLAAIQWVRTHIHAFGGDATQITLGGVSAGAGSIVHLLGAPELQGNITGAILQSPSITAHMPDEARLSRRAIAALLGCEPTRAALASQPLHRVVRVVARLLFDYDLRRRYEMSPKHFFPLRPVADGGLVRADPLAHLRDCWKASGAKPPKLLVGANEDEMNFYLVPDAEINRVDWLRVRTFAQAIGLTDATWREEGNPGERLATLQGAHYYQGPAQRLASLARDCGTAAWHYRFAWKSPQYAGRLGAAHAMEVPFVFNRLSTDRAVEMTGSNAPQTLANAMHSAWAAFARGEAPPDWNEDETKIFA